MAGEHSPVQVAACAANLPHGSAVLREIDPDSEWTIGDVLDALLLNHIRMLAYALGGGKGEKPETIGPSWMRGKAEERKADAMVMTVDQLMEELSRPRKGVENG